MKNEAIHDGCPLSHFSNTSIAVVDTMRPALEASSSTFFTTSASPPSLAFSHTISNVHRCWLDKSPFSRVLFVHFVHYICSNLFLLPSRLSCSSHPSPLPALSPTNRGRVGWHSECVRATLGSVLGSSILTFPLPCNKSIIGTQRSR